jgi:DNA-binding protein YbaB
MTEPDFRDLADVSDALAALRLHADRMLALSEQMRAIRVEETSEDGAVTVVVDGEGGLMDIRLSPAISRMAPDEFTRQLVDTSHAAARRAIATHGELVAAFHSAADDTSENCSGPAELT